MTNQIIEWLKHPLWLDTAAYWWVLGAVALVVNEWVSRSKSVRANSIAAVLPFILQTLLVRVGLLRLPVAGPMIVRFLEALSGVDIDGDGRIAGKTPPKGLPTVPPTIVLLGLLALGSTSCGHVAPVVEKFVDCSAPEFDEMRGEWKLRVIEVLACTGAQQVLIPPCVAAGLAELYRDHGREVVDCALIAIRDSFAAPPGASPDDRKLAALVRARAAEAIKQEEKLGARFVARPGT